MFTLKCKIQNYEWGKIGRESTVGQLAEKGKHTTLHDDVPYAEFWMGVHPNGPSVGLLDNIPLAQVIKNPDYLGKHEEGTLQFLFKVLSVQKALSIQTHPTKEQAVLLHAKDPKNYPDDNHKPEMAIALTDFELLCGFRPPEEIYRNIRKYSVLRKILGEQCCHMEDLLNSITEMRLQALQKIFTCIWSTQASIIADHVKELVIQIESNQRSIDDVERLMIRINNEFPGDVGVLAPLLLNYFTLKPGQATFLGPNRPHAYLFGDCIECMACSDNTIRAGLTPKFKDISTLCTNLDYKMAPPPLMNPTVESPCSTLYAPSTPEFAVRRVTGNYDIPCGISSSISIIVSGSASIFGDDKQLHLERGTVLFTPKYIENLKISDASQDFCLYQAFTPCP